MTEEQPNITIQNVMERRPLYSPIYTLFKAACFLALTYTAMCVGQRARDYLDLVIAKEEAQQTVKEQNMDFGHGIERFVICEKDTFYHQVNGQDVPDLLVNAYKAGE